MNGGKIMGAVWMIYGAYGYTGELVAREAVRRGHRPVLAGRNAAKLEPLARELDLPWKSFALDEPAAVTPALQGVELVFHAAGPFIETSTPMLSACLENGSHYVDITGELSVLEKTFTYDQAARQAEILLLSGAGFDVIPSDCLAAYVAHQLPEATHLETAIVALSRSSGGTAQSSIEMLAAGGKVRRDGRLVPYPLGQGARQLRFPHKERTVLPIPWGDLATAFRSTGIPNITCYMAFPAQTARMVQLFGPVVQKLFSIRPIRRRARAWAGSSIQGPDEFTRSTRRSYIYACVSAPDGRHVEAWLETMEAYQLTAVAGVLAVEKIFAGCPSGALSPAQALGADFVLQIPNTYRLDNLPD